MQPTRCYLFLRLSGLLFLPFLIASTGCQGLYGTTPFISANRTSNRIVWMIDRGKPLQSGTGQSTAALRDYHEGLTTELDNSGANAVYVPGHGIKFTSPVVAKGKVYVSTAYDLISKANLQGELNAYELN